MIFDESKTKSEIKNEITSHQFDYQTEKRFLWKIDQVSRYRSWTDEKNSENSERYHKITFEDLTDRISYPLMFRYQKDWTRNSLEKLKIIFSKIGSQRNSSIIK